MDDLQHNKRKNKMKSDRNNNANGEIEIYGDSLVKLHKVLKEDDKLKVVNNAHKKGIEPNTRPVIIIDFANVTSIQEDCYREGTVIMDNKQAVIVYESVSDVLDVWLEVLSRLNG